MKKTKSTSVAVFLVDAFFLSNDVAEKVFCLISSM